MSDSSGAGVSVPSPADVAAKAAERGGQGQSADGVQDAASSSERSDGAEQRDVFDREYVEKLRREAAGYRTKLKEYEPLVRKFREQEDANKSELEKAQERIAELEAERQAQAAAAVRARVAADAGVPVDLLPETTDEDALNASAKALKEWAKEQSVSGAPRVDRVGSAGGGGSRDEIARAVLGL